MFWAVLGLLIGFSLMLIMINMMAEIVEDLGATFGLIFFWEISWMIFIYSFYKIMTGG